MSGYDFIVPARSWDAIGAVAIHWRTQLGVDGVEYLPIMDLIERVLDQKLNFVRFEVGGMMEMGPNEGCTDPNAEFIVLRDDVYRKACAGEGRARFTAAHELGHLALHTNGSGPLMPRAQSSVHIPPYRLSEPQANQFAAEILIRRSSFGSPTLPRRSSTGTV